MTNNKSSRKKTVAALSENELLKRRHIKDIRITMDNIGFHRIRGIEGSQFTYQSRVSELDDMFIYENLIVIFEYTSDKEVSRHLLKKKVIYDLINNNHRAFVEFLLSSSPFVAFKDYYENNIRNKFSAGQIRIRILYSSIKSVEPQYKELFKENKSVYFYDYDYVFYFKALAATIKRSAKYELFHFLNVKASDIGNCVSDLPNSCRYKGNILPVEKSSFKDGHNIISFYIDAESLIRRAYVLRQDSWQEDDAGGFYQRMVIGKKITSMRKYLATEGRVFINNIIATISDGSAQLLDEKGNIVNMSEKGFFLGNDPHDQVMPAQVQIDDIPNIIGIIDGQHRVYAYHEGNDAYEEKVAELRKQQHLLVTAILFPRSENMATRRRFEATLFREINNNQTNINSQLKQDIDVMISPFSVTAISKNILSKLNEDSPLAELLAIHSYDKGKLKTASIVSYGLIPLVKLDDSQGSDSLFKIWQDPDKKKLHKDCEEYELKQKYVDFCVEKIRDILIAVKRIAPEGLWKVYDPRQKQGLLSVTFINGFLNVLRRLIKGTDSLMTSEQYYERIKNLDLERLKIYKSSQYNKMGGAILKDYIQPNNGNYDG